MVSPSEGILISGDSQTLTVTLLSEGLAAGEYTGNIFIQRNAPGADLQLPVEFFVGASDADENGALPSEWSLADAYPNPFNATATLRFSLPHESFTTILLYDVQGRIVQSLWNGDATAGTHTIQIDGGDLATGIYFAALQSENFSATRKIILLK